MSSHYDETARHSFDAVSDWLAKARQGGPQSAPAFSEPLFLEGEPNRSIVKAAPLEKDGRQMIAVELKGIPTGEPRYVLPVHFAAMRLLELVPGITLQMKNKSPDEYPEDKRIYAMILKVSPRLRESLGRQGIVVPTAISLMRVLFDAPADAQLYEIYGRDHHIVLPSNYVLTKLHKKSDTQGQARALDAVSKLFEAFPPASISSGEMSGLLGEAFKLGNDWHGHELVGRP